MTDSGCTREEVEQIKQGLLALGGITVNDLTGEGLALIADTGVAMRQLHMAAHGANPEEGPEPADGAHGTCAVCGGGIRYQACPTGGWWIHDTHPDDDHDARLGGPA